jgi:hypothetical protein
MARYYVTVPSKREHWGPYTRLLQAQDFARIGSQHGSPREVRRGTVKGKLVRKYKGGERAWPTTKAQLQKLQPGEVPRGLRKNPRESDFFKSTARAAAEHLSKSKGKTMRNPRDVGVSVRPGEVDETLAEDVAMYLWQDFLRNEAYNAVEDGRMTPREQKEFEGSYAGSELALSLPPAVLKDAKRIIAAVQRHYGMTADEVLEEISQGEPSDPDYVDFSYYLAMQTLGQGVAWSDNYDTELWTPDWSAAIWEGYDAAYEEVSSWLEQ